MSNKYNVTQKIIPGAYPQVHLSTSVTKITDDKEKNDTIYVQRELADWASFTPESVAPTIVYTLGLVKTIENNVWEESLETIEGELWGFIRVVSKEFLNTVCQLSFAVCKDPLEARNIRDSLAKINDVDIGAYWTFKYGDGIKKPILNMLNHSYMISINRNIKMNVSYEEIPEYNGYTCEIVEVVKKENDSNEKESV